MSEPRFQGRSGPAALAPDLVGRAWEERGEFLLWAYGEEGRARILARLAGGAETLFEALVEGDDVGERYLQQRRGWSTASHHTIEHFVGRWSEDWREEFEELRAKHCASMPPLDAERRAFEETLALRSVARAGKAA